MTVRKGNIEVRDERKSGYFYDGKEIILMKQPGPVVKRSNPNWYPQEKKVEACTLYAVYGNMEETSKLAKVPVKTLKEWAREPWWTDILKEVYVEQNDKLSAQITDVLADSLIQLKERLDNGDHHVNYKTGKTFRKPVDAKVLQGLFHSLAIQRRLMRGEPTSIVAKQSTDDRLSKLAEEFQKFAAAKQVEAISTETGEDE